MDQFVLIPYSVYQSQRTLTKKLSRHRLQNLVLPLDVSEDFKLFQNILTKIGVYICVCGQTSETKRRNQTFIGCR